MKLMIINGPNINMLGIREKNIYGNVSYLDLLDKINIWAKELGVDVNCFQSNHEGEIIDFIQKAYFDKYDGIIINPAGYTHTSIAILDALKSVNLPVIEVHISDIYSREEFRKKSFIKEACLTSIIGHGIEGYHMALELMQKELKERKNDYYY